jgi:hypothetical protein
MRNLEKAEFWAAISMVSFAICGVLVANQLGSPATRAFLPTHLPLWVLGTFSVLMILSVFNLLRYSLRKA